MDSILSQVEVSGIAGAVQALAIAGCASIVTGTEQTMTFNSEPDGATVIVAGKTLGKTPLTVKVPKDKNMSLTFEFARSVLRHAGT